MANNYFGIIADRGALSDQFNSVGAQTTRNTTTPINGTSDIKLAYPAGASVTYNTQFQALIVANTGFTPTKLSCTFLMKFDATPAAAAPILQIGGGNYLFLSVNKKIMLNVTETTDAALTAGTIYRIEVIMDLDWRGKGSGSILARQRSDGGAEPTIKVQFDTTPYLSTFQWGVNQSKATTGPAVNIQIKDICWWYSDDSTVRAPWLNNQNPQAYIAPTANGSTYNQWTGVGSTTNKYANVDEDPASATDYNTDGVANTTRTQGYVVAQPAYGGTIRGYAATYVCIGATDFTPSDVSVGFRFGGVDYSHQISNYVINVSATIGFPFEPGSSTTITNADIGNTEYFEYITDGANAGTVRLSAMWVQACTGDAFTGNGIPPTFGAYKVYQAINRSGTY